MAHHRFDILVLAGVMLGASACALVRHAPGVDVNNDSPGAIARATGLDEPAADRMVAARPYWEKHDLLVRRVLSESQYAAVQDRLYIGPPGMPEYMKPVPPVSW
jgi:hypothetical protein